MDKYTAPASAVIAAPAPVDEHTARAPAVIAVPAPREEYIASTPIVYATSAPVAENMRRRRHDRGASASGRVHSAGAIRVKSAAPMGEYCVPAPAVIAATAPLDEYVAQHWSRSRRKHDGRVSCGSASPCTMDFCENVMQWSEMPIRQVAANSETIILASVDSGSSHMNGLFLWSRGAFYPSRLASSPWVTAVDATRFVDQQPGQEEMAADQFGSGGGFSKMFDAFSARKAVVKLRFDLTPWVFLCP